MSGAVPCTASKIAPPVPMLPPGAVVLAACLLLDHLGDHRRAANIRNAFEGTIREGTVLTRDLGGTASTDQFTDAVIAKL